ncbi:methyltransferase [Streptomyces radicis]|uniref:Methyltransferase n=1 Tax=Streptomyces radicis TaxID=1750517 RepID=A0A3A9VWE1_9ACTN|nr:methyltransferase [Streptomyces radicis]RKN04493.1 methyltransferase [Streptomyces radicis]RKN15471.1 methyltransferase [Streptomyces radicis]
MERKTTGPDLLEQLPPPLPTPRIIALNRPRADQGLPRHYAWNGWTFDVPPGVFMPGGTSRMIHQRLLDGDIEVRGRRYAAMGVGLGVEAVVAGLRGARAIHAVDVHEESVATAARHYARLVGERPGTAFVPVVADVFDGFPDGVLVDVVTFNPPAVSQPVSDDPDIVRNVCVGTPVLAAFFGQLAERKLLAPGGEVFVVVSNTADLRGIVGHALRHGFRAEVHHRHDWHDGVLTYILRFGIPGSETAGSARGGAA